MNRTRKVIVTAVASAGLALSTAALGVFDDRTNQKQDPAKHVMVKTPPTLPAGIRVKEQTDYRDLQRFLSNVTEAAMDKGGYDNVVRHLNDQDRDRIGGTQIEEARREKYDGRIEQIRKAWKARYGDDFEIGIASEGEMGPFTNVTFLRGEVEDPALVIKSWPVNAHGAPVENTPGAAQETQRLGGGDVNLDKGREVAIAYFPGIGMDKMPVTVSIVGEIQAWKIDLPNHIDGNHLYESLLTHLTAFGEKEAEWPATKVEAQRMAAHCVMMALYDIKKDGIDKDRDMNRGQNQNRDNSGMNRDATPGPR